LFKKHDIMKALNKFTLITITFLALFASSLNAQQKTALLTPKEQQTVIDSISSKLNTNYIFQEVATKMSTSMQSKLKKRSPSY